MMGNKTILLVEDQLEFAAVQRVSLERNGYHVLTAADGEEGVRCAREFRPDLILMDFSLPRVDGLDATRTLKGDPLTRDIPVILVTAHGYGSVGRRAREAGCSAFVPKPCEPSRVLMEVEHLIGAADRPRN